MRIAIATDAWFPQVNGVVRTLAATVEELRRRGHEVEILSPDRFLTLPLPFYRSLRVAVAPRSSVRRMLDRFAPEIVHIPTEGPIGWAARGWCRAQNVPFTTAFHTRFPDYAAVRTGLKPDMFWPFFERFHAGSGAVLVSTASLEAELAQRGFHPIRRWTRGIDSAVFHPDGATHPALADLPRPILLNVGRVACEKNLEAFLDLETPGTKVVVGDGPALASLKARYPDAHFLGSLSGEELASAYRAADCFVFPSLTDTFGLVVIEALACGVPVAAYPVSGPLDILGRDARGEKGDAPAPVGCLDDDLARAVEQALGVTRADAARFARAFTWEAATDQFEAAIRDAVAGGKPASLKHSDQAPSRLSRAS